MVSVVQAATFDILVLAALPLFLKKSIFKRYVVRDGKIDGMRGSEVVTDIYDILTIFVLLRMYRNHYQDFMRPKEYAKMTEAQKEAQKSFVFNTIICFARNTNKGS